MNAHNLPDTRISIPELVQEYEARRDGGQVTRTRHDGIVDVVAEFPGIEAALAGFNDATAALNANCRMGTTYTGSMWREKPSIDAKDCARSLLRQAWRTVYDRLRIATVAPAGDRNKIEQMIEGEPPAFTIENIIAEFGEYVADPYMAVLRGLAEQFVKLDPSFRSHEKMKVGVKGLPKRIIMGGCSEDYAYRNNGAERLMDVINAVRAYTKNRMLSQSDLSTWMKAAKDEPARLDGLTLKRYMNGNAHLHFDPDMLLMVNRALAEFYGEVVPDCPEAAEDLKRRPGTEVSKDLQFYPTPEAVVDWLMARAHITGNTRNGEPPVVDVLEPSCGTGEILDGLRRWCKKLRDFEQVQIRAAGIEVDAGRAEIARSKGYSVMTANFLQTEPRPIYDYVLMNPPFYGKHYQKHVTHARRFLKPGGTLYAILPVTAVEDHGFVERDEWGRDKWEDLPVGSFSASGTNINTGIARFFAED